MALAITGPQVCWRRTAKSVSASLDAVGRVAIRASPAISADRSGRAAVARSRAPSRTAWAASSAGRPGRA